MQGQTCFTRCRADSVPPSAGSPETHSIDPIISQGSVYYVTRDAVDIKGVFIVIFTGVLLYAS